MSSRLTHRITRNMCDVTFRHFSTKRSKVSVTDMKRLKLLGKPITMVTAYDYPSAVHVDLAGIDVLLVGDSLGMVELGMDTTLPVTMEAMIHHCQAVKRGAFRALVVADMPFGSCEGSAFAALANAQRFLKEAEVDCVKIEGGKDRAATIRTIVQAGVAVMGHIGLQPQHVSVMGGFKAQGRTAKQAERLVEDALAVESAGACALVIECVPPIVAQEITRLVTIPTIGIGAGPHTNGQVLVFHDLLGMLQHPHHANVAPRFCKRYAELGQAIQKGLEAYRQDVESGSFPSPTHTPYTMTEPEQNAFQALMSRKKRDSDTVESRSSDDSIRVY